MTIFRLDPEGIELDSSKSCKPYYPTDKCGGCDACLLEQAWHYGHKVVEVPDLAKLDEGPEPR